MKIFGHPLHLMLIHFPSALFPMDLICSFIAYGIDDTSFLSASFYAMLGGVLLGWLAAVTGMIDVGKLATTRQSSVKKALIHGGINATVLIVYTVFVMLSFKKYPHLSKGNLPILIVKTFLVTLMIVGNFIGGSLVLKDKVLDK